jgi:hypothetical protein
MQDFSSNLSPDATKIFDLEGDLDLQVYQILPSLLSHSCAGVRAEAIHFAASAARQLSSAEAFVFLQPKLSPALTGRRAADMNLVLQTFYPSTNDTLYEVSLDEVLPQDLSEELLEIGASNHPYKILVVVHLKWKRTNII